MKRIQEKVKDLVEVRSYQSLNDFLSDSVKTLNSYHFTDITADLMSKWLDEISDIQPNRGAAKALAGYRGVGKSHFLAALGAAVSHPEMRSRISDSVVSASAERLKRRRHPVAYVRRGTNSSLFEELKDALAVTLEVPREDLFLTTEELLKQCSEKAADLPFLIIVDTAFDRSARVSRDDGVLLGELAEIAGGLNIFIAVALDDDIAGADGVNAAIARSYTIDYLDQEHLYKIVDTHIFPKLRQASTVIQDIYTYFRGLLPSFRWSDRRFASLYPLHPMILEVAPYVRLYSPEFALLSFASEAGTKVQGRPANSLVGLDEVFDRNETNLRKAEDLKEAFVAYDQINNEVISQIPVMQRLQAKLVLKALILLSLDGNGTTAGEISAAMLIYDENPHEKSFKTVEDIIEKFVQALPDSLNRIEEYDRDVRYSFRVSGKDNLNEVLREAAKEIPSQVVPKVLRRFAGEKLNDWLMTADKDAVDAVQSYINWRGGERHGRLIWNWGEESKLSKITPPGENLEWEIFISDPNRPPISSANAKIPLVTWKPAVLTLTEIETVLRYSVLVSDETIARNYSDQVRAVGHSLSSSIIKIWNRVFLEEGKLFINGAEIQFTERAKSFTNLPDLLTEMFTPLFDERYPEHPIFADKLGINEVSALVGDFLGGASATTPETQALAVNFAAPLGLVTLRGEHLFLENYENISRLPLIEKINEKISQSDGQTILLSEIYALLRTPPYGLERETVQILLSAMVAQRRIEFVTSKGDRINRRSLDLKIIWDDIVGIAPPIITDQSDAQLAKWAKLLTGRDNFVSTEDPEDQEKVLGALQNWLDKWQSSEVLKQFEKFSEDTLNTKIWRVASNVQKTFNGVAVAVEDAVKGNIKIEECLVRIADSFANSEESYLERTRQLAWLEDYLAISALRKTVWEYLAVCEITDDNTIEQIRLELIKVLEESSGNPGEVINRELQRLWNSFHEKYAEFYIYNHDLIMNSTNLRTAFDEVLRSDEWWEFERLSDMPVLRNKYRDESAKILRRYGKTVCKVEVHEVLKTHPYCLCSFRSTQLKDWENLPQTFKDTVEKGRAEYRKTLLILREAVTPNIENFAENTPNKELSAEAEKLLEVLNSGEIPVLTNAQLTILEKALATMSGLPTLNVNLPEEQGFVSREELILKFNDWLEHLPKEHILMKF